MPVQKDLRYSPDHLWLRRDGKHVIVGVTEQLSRILTWVKGVALPAAGTRLAAGDELAAIDSQKAEISVPAPAALEVVTINDLLTRDPMLVRMEPRGRGWLLSVVLEHGAWDRLLGPAQYEELLQAQART